MSDLFLQQILDAYGTDCVVMSRADFDTMRTFIREAGLAERLADAGIRFSGLAIDGTPTPESEVSRVGTEGHGTTVWIGPSDGADGAVLVMIDTEFEPDASDGGPGLRVLVNDDPVYEGKPYIPKPED